MKGEGSSQEDGTVLKTLVIRPGKSSSILRTHMVEEQTPQAVSDLHMLSFCPTIQTYIHKYIMN